MAWVYKAKELIRETFSEWVQDRSAQAAAALAFFTLFSLAPLLVVAAGVAGIVYGNEIAQRELLDNVREMIGPGAAQLAHDAIENASAHGRGIWGTIVGTATLLFGATTVFAQLQAVLNLMWRVEIKPGRPVRGFLRARLTSFFMVLLIGVLLLGLLVASTVLSATVEYMEQHLGNISTILWLADVLLSLAVVTVLFAAIFKYLPDVHIAWHEVWIGAMLTATLFTIGKHLISLYFSRSTLASVYGAAGSLVVLLIWVYYSAQILFLGAEFTHVYARARGNPVEPNSHAQKML